jgi:hypothetical protein
VLAHLLWRRGRSGIGHNVSTLGRAGLAPHAVSRLG